MSRSRAGDDGLERVIAFVEDAVPFEPGYYNEAYLGRRIAARMQRRDAADHDEYLGVLRDDDDEREALLDALTVNVTGFFRDPDMWADLRPVLRELSTERRRVNAWSAPCSDGREPYSLAMLAADDDEVTERRVDILATDISEPAIAAARAGVYETTRTTDIGAELGPLSEYEPYVEEDGTRFRVRDRIKQRVTFETHDLIRDGPKSDVDLLFCRNLLIYIDGAYKEPLFETLTASLGEGGYLVVGKTETVPPGCRGAFEPVAKRSRIYRYVGAD
ncbi:CheR family methyltransferase [Candidatus Halobonum tyrrellensis]|uniref:Chemotaxis protein methyltransferase CheR n=1 Tax=Candidatus Halobonum tyrrellensis G22 TaxID=1324957 RepID=V4GWM2_9EURY|nr:protein-glutamate O-methyltransferase CheR [Candidatus Halobonum tyrrellensis]ESP89566.1 chemotaxis protein methyltransferase CheR [Candidatus Halobonum tyrrellensis G22]